MKLEWKEKKNSVNRYPVTEGWIGDHVCAVVKRESRDEHSADMRLLIADRCDSQLIGSMEWAMKWAENRVAEWEERLIDRRVSWVKAPAGEKTPWQWHRLGTDIEYGYIGLNRFSVIGKKDDSEHIMIFELPVTARRNVHLTDSRQAAKEKAEKMAYGWLNDAWTKQFIFARMAAKGSE